MYQNKGNTTIIVIVSVLAIVGLSWMAFSDPKIEEQDLVAVEDNSLSEIEKKIIEQATKVENIDLDLAVLSEPAFKVLVDFSREIVDEPVSRANPFAPINLEELQNIQSSDAGSNILSADNNEVKVVPGQMGGRVLTPREENY